MDILTRESQSVNSSLFIKSIFKETKIKLTIENKMNDYLKTHACAVLPLVFASYKVDGNLKLLKKDKEYSLLIVIFVPLSTETIYVPSVI